MRSLSALRPVSAASSTFRALAPPLLPAFSRALAPAAVAATLAPTPVAAMTTKARASLPLIAVGQMTSSANREDNFKTCADLVARASARRASMLCLPECFHFIGASTGASVHIAESLDGSFITRYCQLAKEHKIWLSLGGFQQATPAPTTKTHVYNAHLIVDDQGRIVSNYHKIHLFDVDAPGGAHRESSYTVGGTKPVVSDSPLGKLGVTVCYDLRFPELYASLAQLGAQIMLIPAAFTLRTGLAHWEVLLRARAIETQSYVVAAAQTGVHNVADSKEAAKPGPLRESYGHAMIIDPWGAVIAQCEEGTGLAFAEIDLERLARIRTSMPVATHHKPEVYPRVPTSKL